MGSSWTPSTQILASTQQAGQVVQPGEGAGTTAGHCGFETAARPGWSHVPPALLHLHVHGQPQDQAAAGSRIRAAKRSLQVLKLLVTATGNTGKKLRREVADRVFTMSNLRGILQHGHQHGELQKLAIDVLTGLVLDDGAKEGMVTRTSGVVKLLLSLFLDVERAYATELRSGAGEALAMLAPESKTNCGAILKMDGVRDRLITALDGRDLRLNAAMILRNLCAYSAYFDEESSVRLCTVTAAMPVVRTCLQRILQLHGGGHREGQNEHEDYHGGQHENDPSVAGATVTPTVVAVLALGAVAAAVALTLDAVTATIAQALA